MTAALPAVLAWVADALKSQLAVVLDALVDEETESQLTLPPAATLVLSFDFTHALMLATLSVSTAAKNLPCKNVIISSLYLGVSADLCGGFSDGWVLCYKINQFNALRFNLRNGIKIWGPALVYGARARNNALWLGSTQQDTSIIFDKNSNLWI
jgi:hypothetical protein